MENIELTPNRMACNAITDENKNNLITTFKSSPKSPAAIGKIEKKKLFRKKAKKVLRQRSRLSSESSQLSNASPLRSQQQVGAPYNLIEYCGDRSRSESASESAQENAAPYNLSAATDSASAITPGSDNFDNLQVLTVRDSEFSTAGVSVHPTPQKVIFVIPEGWASSIEIMRLPLSANSNSLDHSSPSSASTYGQYANSVGPMRSKGKIRSSRNTPYYSSRRDKQSYIDLSELARTVARNYSKNQTVPENFEFARYNNALNGYQYESRDYEQTSSSIGPIRRNNRKKAFYTPYGNTASGMNYNSMDSASTSTISEGYNQADGRPDYSVRRNYKYSNNLNNTLCWYCRKRGHLKVNCPLRMAYKNAEMTASEGML